MHGKSQKKQYKPSTNNQYSVFIALISSLGSWIGDAILYPLDTISTRMKASKYQNATLYNYTRNVVKNQGFMVLFRGFSLTFHCSFLPSVFYLVIYQYLFNNISSFVDKYYTNIKQIKLIFPFFASSFSELIALSIGLPFDVIRSRFQVNVPQYNYKSIAHAFSEVYKTEGLKRLYLSSKIYIVYLSFYTGIQFQSYELIKFYTDHNWANMIINGVFSTALASIICNPLQLVLVRYALVDTTKKQLNLKNMIRKIIKKEGYAGFFKGMSAKIISGCGYSLFWFPLYGMLSEKYGIELND